MQPADHAQRIRERLLRDGRKLLVATGHKDPAGPISVVVVAGQVEVVSEAPPSAPTPTPPPTVPSQLPPLQRAILDVLTSAPVSPRTLARLCGRKFGSRFREGLRRLVDADLARRTSKGYSR